MLDIPDEAIRTTPCALCCTSSTGATAAGRDFALISHTRSLEDSAESFDVEVYIEVTTGAVGVRSSEFDLEVNKEFAGWRSLKTSYQTIYRSGVVSGHAVSQVTKPNNSNSC